MASQQPKVTYIGVSVAIQRTGLPRQVVKECMTRSLVVEPLTDADLAELRRVRRLQELGVNMPGIEIILQMRRRIQSLQADLARLEQMWGGHAWTELEALWQRRLPWEPDE